MNCLACALMTYIPFTLTTALFSAVLTHTFISTLIFVISSILSRWPIYAAQYYHLHPTKNAFTLNLLIIYGRHLKPHSLKMVMESNSKYMVFIINVSRQIHIVTLYHYWPHWKSFPPLHTYTLVLSILKTSFTLKYLAI
jgi:hypothetical protein